MRRREQTENLVLQVPSEAKQLWLAGTGTFQLTRQQQSQQGAASEAFQVRGAWEESIYI